MRRKDRELKDREDLTSILKEAHVCRIAISSDTAPYIVPLNYGYIWDDKLELYFHSAEEGRKIDLLKANNLVGFEIDTSHELLKSDKACNWSMKYRSIIGIGKIVFLTDETEKKQAMTKIMQQHGYADSPSFMNSSLSKILVYKLLVNELSGKQSK